MYLVRNLPLVVALSVGAVASVSHSGEQQPQTAPTRDVDITYQITQPGLPVIIERRRWLAKAVPGLFKSVGFPAGSE